LHQVGVFIYGYLTVRKDVDVPVCSIFLCSSLHTP